MRIGIFGGTFDPVHKAHVAVAEAARDAFGLDKVLLIPAANPPHKQGRLSESWEHRYRMVQLVCRDALVASDLESARTKSYSIDTIERLRRTLAPDDKLYFIIGADAFAEISTWFRWKDVLAAVEFIVVTRPGHQYEVPGDAVVHRLDTLSLTVSSSEIREMLARCEQPAALDDAVFDYIRVNTLYGFGSACDPTS